VLWLRCYEQNQFKIGDFAQRGPVDPKFQVEGVAPTNHSSSQKTTLNDLSYGLIFLPFRHNSCVWQTDGWTDRQTPFSSLVHAGIPCSVKKLKNQAAQNWFFGFEKKTQVIQFIGISENRVGDSSNIYEFNRIPICLQIASTVRLIRSQSLHQYHSSDNRGCHKYCIFTNILKFLLNITPNGHFLSHKNSVTPAQWL